MIFNRIARDKGSLLFQSATQRLGPSADPVIVVQLCTTSTVIHVITACCCYNVTTLNINQTVIHHVVHRALFTFHIRFQRPFGALGNLLHLGLRLFALTSSIVLIVL